MSSDMSPSEPPAKRRRKNASRACDICKSKKIKCDGTLPCARCQSHGLTCAYDAPYNRGLPPPIVPASASTEPTVVNSSPSLERSTHLESPILRQASNTTPFSDKSPLVLTRRDVTPEAALTSIEGVLGASSNIDFSRVAQLQLRSQPPSSPQVASDPDFQPDADGPGVRMTSGARSCLWFSEPPFPPLDLSRYSLPTTERGLTLMSWYFDNASPTYRFLHRPSIERMVYELCASGEWLGGPYASSDDVKLEKTEEALVLMVWALGCQFPLPSNGRPYSSKEVAWLRKKGEDYYQVACLILDQEKSIIDRLSALQARLLMCLYLLTTSRLKAAWDLFAIVKNMVNSLDLHKVPLKFISSASVLQTQLRCRAFWAVYVLDSYLSAMLGKSLTFSQRKIGIGLPLPVDDDALHMAVGSVGRSERPSLMLGPIAHAELAHILRDALDSLYHDQDLMTQARNAEILLSRMETWNKELPAFLQSMDSSSLSVTYARQATVIQLARQHATIMICRPFLSVTELSSVSGSDTPPAKEKIEQYKKLCLDAAILVCRLAMPLTKKEIIAGHFWFTSYIAFCAATVLLVYLGYHPSTLRRQELWDTAEMCCSIERKLMATSALARRYVAALEGLFPVVEKRLRSRSNPHAQLSREIGLEPTAPPPMSRASTTAGAVTGEPDTAALAEDNSFLSADPSLLGNLIEESYGNGTFFDLDSIITGGMEFGWPSYAVGSVQ